MGELNPECSCTLPRVAKGCVIDERFVLLEATTLEGIACCIIHEATHAKLEGCGISYDDEKGRPRIEAICIRRELNFITKLPHCQPLREEIARTLEWCVGDHHDDYFSDVGFRQRDIQGNVEALRYLGAPDWLIRLVLKVRAGISWVQRLAQRFAEPPRQA